MIPFATALTLAAVDTRKLWSALTTIRAKDTPCCRYLGHARWRRACCLTKHSTVCRPIITQVRTRDRKGLLYDSLRATKDLKVNVSYGKV